MHVLSKDFQHITIDQYMLYVHQLSKHYHQLTYISCKNITVTLFTTRLLQVVIDDHRVIKAVSCSGIETNIWESIM